MNYATIVIDYYLQFLEDGASKEKAVRKTQDFLDRFRGKMDGNEYWHIMNIIVRISYLV